MLKRLLHEPLIHFLLIGGLIFSIFSLKNPTTQSQEIINISKAQIKQLQFRWQKKHFREPSKEELHQLIEQKIYEKIMVNEALGLGLEKNDPIINRRLMQKIEFISTDLAQLQDPSDKELLTYLQEHPKAFAKAPKISFKQLYFSTQEEALSFLKQLDTSDFKTGTYRNTFMLDTLQNKLTQQELSRNFGKHLAQEVFVLKEGTWQGPIRSGYGFHLVYITQKNTGELPPLDSLKQRLKKEWLNAKQKEINQAFYQDLRKNYTIKVEN